MPAGITHHVYDADRVTPDGDQLNFFIKSQPPWADFTKLAYDNNMPMGGDLSADGNGSAPRLLVRAGRDPDGANPDPIKVVIGVELPEGAPESFQERAYTSPIWYLP